MRRDIVNTILEIYPNVVSTRKTQEGVFSAFDKNGVEVILDMDAVNTEHSKHDYIVQREEAYPPIGDQLDALFHAGVFPSEMAAQIQAVKDKYPKS